ncbi:glucose-6-phosphate dehydrogenase assembly protein OpcA [Microterricola viridarii]|uniref:OpcA protein n=1 Tax=Microterricola viridarii TaxID=412690 RepID=A0A109QWT3_9MICO|nr:glucose-6-phosphate dehydrogenase assembly protein OpcA [Microterricola viridarii]AMB58399.1 OpcA protein [Microterricola viridarii]
MIIDLPNTTISQVSKALVKMRDENGVVALGRVLTLIIAASTGSEEEAIEAANDASREHPMRVLVVCTNPADADQGPVESRLDAEIRVGGDAGASEVIILRASGEAASDEQSLVMGLLLPDAPVVTWWPGLAPTVPGLAPLGRIAHRRITDASAQPNPQAALQQLAENYKPGDIDFAWTRLTLWRAQLAAVLDQPPYSPVTAVYIEGSDDSPSTTLLSAWLQFALEADTEYVLTPGITSHGIHSVRLERSTGAIELSRTGGGVARLTQPEQPTHSLALPRRNLRDCLADELRRLDPDELYGLVITEALARLGAATPMTTRSAV